ncbi:M13 family metallopeptidase [Nostoc sp. FACHB-152]|uniref:M13 family metallopeptidase n=1 Tax=unclassified Nostoc TaxID=2593658 RepID=UPI001685B352|nr:MULTISPECIES: M13 family metallopeptidase [unclassified Nostoc]MBD2450729.1 M13 family metallopeptidase [Nostoc sp. FACHB-152]MBD2471941.1 M13 family metallopeptidase [Nostoc sp. FACHB-145]
MKNNKQFRVSWWLTSSILLVLGICTTSNTTAFGNHSHSNKAEQVSQTKFPLGFSVNKIDTTVDPKQDFYRFAAGKWLDSVEPTPEFLRVSGADFLDKEVSKQLQQILSQAATQSTKASKGSPLQQVGDLYVSGMDEKRVKALGVLPLKPIFERIDAINSPQTLTKTLADLSLILGISDNPDILMFGVQIGADIQDRTINTVYIGDRTLLLSQVEYLNPDAAPIRAAYLKFVTANLEIAGSSPAQATAAAKKILEIETRLAKKKLTPVEKKDLNRRFNKMPFAKFQSLLSNFDLKTYFEKLGLPTEGNVIVVESQALAELNQILQEYPIEDIKTYLRWAVLFNAKPYLTPAFNDPALALFEARVGKIKLPSRADIISGQIPKLLGHPLSQLYVKEYFSPESKQRVESMIGRIKSVFRARLAANSWLSDTTRKSALEKLDRMVIKVAYPEKWIDYSGIDIRPDDYFGNVTRIKQFLTRRNLALVGKPVTRDEFNSKGTLPIVINAAYDASNNGIEIPAAFLQPPYFDPKGDAAVNFCTIGAVIGHEITHGFDSEGRLSDAQGNLRNWWTEEDAAKFVAQTDKLVKQADAFEVLPGLKLNGKLSVGENLADVGGVSLAYEALQGYLKENPQANQKINGYTPQQRCFIAWGQLWASKTNEGSLRQNAATEEHPPGPYRVLAPLQHEDGFYKAFDIKPGDPMWLDEKDRVKIW